MPYLDTATWLSQITDWLASSPGAPSPMVYAALLLALGLLDARFRRR